jgi:hypothetical protein
MALATDESENRSPVNLAKFGQCRLRLVFVIRGIRTGRNDAPSCGHEARLAEAVNGGFRFHRSRASHFIGSHASWRRFKPGHPLGDLSDKSEVFLKLRPPKAELKDEHKQLRSVQ